MDYLETGVVKVSMIKSLQRVIYELPEDPRGIYDTPAEYHMLQVMGEEEL